MLPVARMLSARLHVPLFSQSFRIVCAPVAYRFRRAVGLGQRERDPNAHCHSMAGVSYRTGPESPRLQSGDAWLVNSPRQAALLLSELGLSPWGILAWGSDP